MKIPINIDLATRFLQSPDSEKLCKSDDPFKDAHTGKPLREILTKYLRYHTKQGFCELSFGFCSTGQSLVDAAIISGARVYSKHSPFSLPSELNDILMSNCVNFDMSKAYPRFLLSLSPPQSPAHRLLSEFLTTGLQPIMDHYDVTRKVAKKLIPSLCMDGKIGSWRAKHGVDQSIENMLFIREFAVAMSDLTSEFASTEQGKAGIALLSKKRKREEHTPPERTWKSFLLQSIEYKVREAMIGCLHANGAAVYTQEHDGARAILPDGAEPKKFEAMLTDVASKALGADCPICIKPVNVSFQPKSPEEEEETQETLAPLAHQARLQRRRG